ncbi:hypothetical protein KDAU_27350 [Dictyobacter aurantiacus]|uniref:Uncharacterized protein n=1 Tax=Dictyobacter aurantiacus TaxID=1936993 RepID=A0A401ZEY4_9CHLR|nr:hypothetical protein KDAU_27350 [Dictyobacter aurantiacus]
MLYTKNEEWWSPDPEADDALEQPALGGEYELGTLRVFQGKRPLSGPIPIIATLPAGWLPEAQTDDAIFFDAPIFLDTHHVQIHLPTGKTWIYRFYL